MPRHHQPDPFECPDCGALVGNVRKHADWHRDTDLQGWRPQDHRDNDDTVTLPPLRDTVFRRPPPPEVRELRGAELLRALADAMESDPDTSGHEL